MKLYDNDCCCCIIVHGFDFCKTFHTRAHNKHREYQGTWVEKIVIFTQQIGFITIFISFDSSEILQWKAVKKILRLLWSGLDLSIQYDFIRFVSFSFLLSIILWTVSNVDISNIVYLSDILHLGTHTAFPEYSMEIVWLRKVRKNSLLPID